MAFVIVWEFEAKPEELAAFEHAYGQGGEWVRLFDGSPGYLGTELLKDHDRPGRYSTVDRWASRDAFDAHHTRHRAAYQALDRKCEALTASERLVGWFDTVD